MHLKTVLPEEILLEIFGVTEKSELKKFLEISSVWRDLLIKDVKVMRKLPLVLISDTWREKLEFVENYGKFIREVQFVDAEIESFDEIHKILELTPNVEKLSLIDVRFKKEEKLEESEENIENQEIHQNPNNQEIDHNQDNHHNQGVHLNQDFHQIPQDQPEEELLDEDIEKLSLKFLSEIIVIDNENLGVLKFIATHFDVQLSTFRCNLSLDAHLPILQKILADNQQLKTFELKTDLDEIFNPSDEIIGTFAFQLEKLLIKTPMMKHNEQFMKFLTSQKPQMKVLGFDAGHVDFRYHQMMFTHFPILQEIRVNIDSMSTTDCLLKMRRTPTNKTLKALNILGRNLHLNSFEALLRIFPFATHLKIRNLTQFYSDKIRSMPLTHLVVDRVNCEHLRAEKIGKSTKITLTEIISLKDNYGKNLQSFCDLNRLCDKTKGIIEAF